MINKKRARRSLSFLFSLLLAISLLICLPAAAEATDGNWTTVGNYAAATLTNDGATYTIDDAAELAWVAVQVKVGNSFSDKTIKLSSNIDLSAHYWTPIGSFAGGFKGTFDGDNRIISNLLISTSGSSSEACMGLFGYTEGATIQNVGVANANIDSSDEDDNAYIGGLVGAANNSSTITNSYVTGSVKGKGECDNIGGLVGDAFSSIITNSYATVSVTGGDWNVCVGGLVGRADASTITNSYATGSVRGGETSGGDGSYVGGLVGAALVDSYDDTIITKITNSYATGSITGGGAKTYAGGLVGVVDASTITNSYWRLGSAAKGVGEGTVVAGTSSENMKIGQFVVNLNAGGTAWKADTDSKNAGYPVLNGVGVGIQTGTIIDSLVRMIPVSSNTNAGSVIYRATFGTGVTGVGTSNFDLNPTVNGAAIASVAVVPVSSNTQWDITVNTGTGDGTLTPRFVNDTGLSLSITTTKPYSNQSYTIDKTPPAISIGAPSAALTTTGPVTYTVTYSDANFSSSTLAVGNITLNKTGSADGALAVSGAGLTRTVTISSITGNGTLGISLAAGTSSDTAGNTAPAAGPSTTFTVENTPPASSDATLKATSTVKGQTVTSLGTPNATLASATAGTVTITAAKAADMTGATTFVTLFDKNDATATVTKVVKYASGGNTGGFASDAAYENFAIGNNDFFIIQVIAADASVLYYKIVVTVTPDGSGAIEECFIATAAYGSKYQPAVKILRRFRDDFLLTNQFGQAFVRFYYHNSPPIANYIARNEGLKGITRLLLSPFVCVIYLMYNPVLALSLLLIMVFLGIYVRRQRVKQVNI